MDWHVSVQPFWADLLRPLIQRVTGAMSITKVTSPAVIRISAATAICFSIVGKLSALLQSIPQAVLGGIMLLLFGTIASVGVQNLMQNKVDMNETRNVIIISVMLTMGLVAPFFIRFLRHFRHRSFRRHRRSSQPPLPKTKKKEVNKSFENEIVFKAFFLFIRTKEG